MTNDRFMISRRTFGTGLAAAGMSAGLMGRAFAQQNYPSQNFRVVIPTGQGGGAERLARAFDDVWSKSLGQQFEYSFHPGAAGQIGYELFVNRREHDGHNLLFGNMGPEMIMYVAQKPNYEFPKDFTYFCRMDVDDSCVFAKRDSEFKDVKAIVEAAKKRPLNVAVSRIPHPASIGILALGEATGAQFNLVPYGGGNPTYIAVLNGEADIGALPITGVLSLADRLKVMGIFNRTENLFAKMTEDAPLINAAFGTDIPDLYSSRAWAIHADWANANPDKFTLLQKTAKEAHDSAQFREAFAKTGAPVEALKYGDREVCADYAQKMVDLAKRYEKVLTAQK
jgi:tripartite-type tricarboxylate transporter receptor subunit TctC